MMSSILVISGHGSIFLFLTAQDTPTLLLCGTHRLILECALSWFPSSLSQLFPGLPCGLLPLSCLSLKQHYFLGSVWVLCPSYSTLSLRILSVSGISHSLNATNFLLHVYVKSRLLSEFKSIFLKDVNHYFTGNSNSMWRKLNSPSLLVFPSASDPDDYLET